MDCSNLISNDIFTLFDSWVNQSINSYTLLYRATRDGFDSSSFHSTCDNRGPTITLIQSDDGNVFGGYNSQSWNSNDEFYGDNKCFIFTIKNKNNIGPTKYISNKNGDFVYGGVNDGPIFGFHDIRIMKNSNKCQTNYQSFPNTYQDTSGFKGRTFASTFTFKVEEIEIFKIEKRE
ncbi:hypothetical protein CYY_004367 [Polysphondylium violaceum]|uniref:TLDc domain-containing protein n=1 Tax=Polysphondylium violaceum TaxID=133409 RepID=A0A8J4PVJ6_9MYCE|nr:hypothetical protein CYY_004367 [Polysphondylium violaceum]